MAWLVTGGAGYIGAHVVHALRAIGERVIVIDDMSAGIAARLPQEVPLIRADVADRDIVRETLICHGINGVVHLAARKDVAESSLDPLGYYRTNVEATSALLETMADCGVDTLVFSSTAAVYGSTGAYSEDAPCRPANPYGRTKLAAEWLVTDTSAALGIRYAILRFFNVAGAGARRLGDVHGTNLLPTLLRAVAAGDKAVVYGGEHGTPDGSCIRDYVHVVDVAEAHVATALALRDEKLHAETLNIGRGVGVSVLELLAAVERATGCPLPYTIIDPRPGDPPHVVADPGRIRERIGWQARHDLDDIVYSAWEAHR